MANTAFQNVDDEVLAAVQARKAVLEEYRLSVLAGENPETYGHWVEVTEAEYAALTPREGVLYAIVAE